MKILVLGNGFDLDHKLPTSYMDFLNFCNCVLNSDENSEALLNKLKKPQLEYITEFNKSTTDKNYFLSLIKNNVLLSYFNKKINKIGTNWIDFEREIKYIINAFVEIEGILMQSDQFSYYANSDHKIHDIILDLGLGYITTDAWTEIKLSTIYHQLCDDLNTFSIALEYYIARFINNTPVIGISPDIVNFDADNIISFNYSNTYERIYGGIRWDEKVDHIHGVASAEPHEDSRIILGITSENGISRGSYVEFEKYFQRITKGTGSEYQKWMQASGRIKSSFEVMFFGHSLDSSDSDIINDLINNENSTILIYYYDQKAYKQIVANLIEIIGKEKLIKTVSGKDPKIKFIKQQSHIDNSNAGIEIKRDIRALYNMHLLSKVEINILLAKIKEKITQKDIVYFHSQRKTISMFEILCRYKVENVAEKDFLEICSLLPYENNNERLEIYYTDEWEYHTSWDEEPCCIETASLISAVNHSNQKRFEPIKTALPFFKIKNMTDPEEIKDGLLDILDSDIPSEELWIDIHKLIQSMYDGGLFEKALNLMTASNYHLPLRSKIMHLAETYYEHAFYIEYDRQMSENEVDEVV